MSAGMLLLYKRFLQGEGPCTGNSNALFTRAGADRKTDLDVAEQLSGGTGVGGRIAELVKSSWSAQTLLQVISVY